MAISAHHLNLYIHGEERQIDFSQIPVPKLSTKEIFEELSFEPPEATSTLKNRCETLKSSAEKYQKAKDRSIRDKLFALFLAASAILNIAAVILLTAIPPIQYSYIALGFLNHILVSSIANDTYKGNPGIEERTRGILPKLGMPFIAVSESFTKISRFASLVNVLKLQVESDFDILSTFYSTEYKSLDQAIENALKNEKKDLAKLKKIKIISPTAKKAINLKIEALKFAQTELKKLNEYYSQFKK